MTARPELPRIPSIASLSYSFNLRRSSLASEDDVFADEHALDSPATIDNAPLGSVPAPRQQYFDDPFHDRNASSSSILRQNTEPTFADRDSTSKQRLMIDDMPSSSRGLGRSISTSSRLTIPRAPSPYNGPTAPSRQYEMHNQLTRSASIASQSTFRPGSETPFVFPRRGPEHPYELYTQNVSPEEDDITANGIPVLGFPRNFQSSSRGGSSADTGDIIGNDGHIEQLPPYTRYADNTVAKGDMNGFNTRRSSRASRAPTTASAAASSSEPGLPSAADSTTLLRPQPLEQFEEETVEQRARKEGWRTTWRERAQNKTFIAGMPLWGLVSIVLIVIFSAIIGGVVGGVIGNRQGETRAYANGAVTTTIWLDAIPTTLGPHSSPLPTGHYQIPFNQSEEIKQCIPASDLNTMGPAWGCMDIAYIGVNVFQDPDTDSMMAAFEDFSVNTQDFRYGPQPPDFNGTAFALSPMQDKDAGELGVAMFFSVLFDKLTILPEYAMNPDDFGNKKRSIGEDVIARSVATYDGKPLKPADQPWFCFWNSTINEFFIYLNQAAPNSSNTITSTSNNKVMTHTSSTMATTGVFSSWTSATAAAMIDDSTMATAPTSGPTVFAAYAPTPVAASPTINPDKRSYDTSAANVSNYPKLIKMLEKRKPINPAVSDYVQPYCQKMQVLWDWNIVPIASVPTIAIQEVQFTLPTSTSTTTSNHRLMRYRSVRDAVSDLESYCICEWTSKQY